MKIFAFNKLSLIQHFTLVALILGIAGLESCKHADDVEIECSQANISISITSTNVDCPQTNGTITITASGDGDTFEFSLDNQTFQNSNVFDNLPEGSYDIYIKNSDNCVFTRQTVIESINDISFTSENMPAGCGGNDGALNISANGGNGNYEFAIDGGNFQTSSQFNNVTNGNHIVTVKDGEGCMTDGVAYVRSGISFNNDIEDIINTYCAVSGCHVDGQPQPDFNIFANIQNNAVEIRSRTQSGNMPMGTTLPDDLIEAIACWVDDGALDN